MTRRTLKILSIVAALAIALTGVATTVNPAVAVAPSAPAAQAADEDKGVLIVAVQRGSPAAKAGLRRGDIILEVNDAEVNDAQALRDALAKFKPGDEVQIRIARGEGERTLKVTLGQADGRAYLGVTPFGVTPFPETATPQAQPGQGNGPAPRPDPQQAEEMRRWLQEQWQRFAPQVRITEVITGSPAEKAGLQKDDLIIAVNDIQLDLRNTLADVIARFKPGDEVTLKIKRGDAERQVKVRLGENPDRKGAAFLGVRYAPAVGAIRLPDGLPHNLPLPLPNPPGQGAPFELPRRWAAVTVGDVASGSPAEKAGLQKGDMILAANDKEIREPGDLVKLVQNSKPGDKISLSVQRAGEEKPIEITVTLGENPDKPGAAYMGVSLGQFIRFERILPGSEESDGEGFEIIPGFRLPFGFGDLPFPFPPNPEVPEMNRRAA